MLELKRFSDIDYKDYKTVIEFVNNHYQNTGGDYYTFLYKDEERVLYKVGDIYTIFFYNEKKDCVDFTMFNYDQEVSQIYVNLGDFLLHKSKTTEALEDENGVIHCLDIVKGKGDYSGYAYYSQFDTKTDTNLTMFYEHHFMAQKGEKQRIYGMRLHDPAKIAIRKNASKKMNKPYMPTNSYLYAKVEYKDIEGSFLYNFLKSETNDKYYRIVACTKNGNLIYLPIITTGYTNEEMKEMIKKYGFRLDVPDVLLDLYNGDILDTSYYWNLVEEELNLNNGMSFIKKENSNG